MAILVPAVPAPQHILDGAARDIGGHVVRVVPAPALEVQHVAEIEQRAQQRPDAQQRGAARRVRAVVEAQVVHDRVVQAVEHVEPRAEVVELLGEAEVARVEDARGRPARDADPGERDVKGPQGVAAREGGADLGEAVEVAGEVEGREEDGEGLLDAEEAREGPFAVELDDGLCGGAARGGDDGLAGVVAFGRAVPEEQSAVESFVWGSLCQLAH